MLRTRSRLVMCVVVWSTLGEQLPLTVFSAREGLPATIGRIVVDSKGFVWVPGSEGLARFDGNAFRIFTASDGLPGSSTSDIVERPDGTYWVAAQEQICLFDPRPQRKRFQCEWPNLGAITALLEDERGLWCGTDRGLWRRPLDGASSWEFVRSVEPTAPKRSIAVERLLKDSRGDVWAATYSGLYRFRRGGGVDRWTRAEGLATDSITTVSETPGSIWAGTQTELVQFRIDPRNGEIRGTERYNRSHGLPSAYTVEVRWWRGQVWAATFQGLARQLSPGRWQAVELGPEVSGLSLESLAIDSLGNLWIGTNGGGAARISGAGLSTFSERDGLGVRNVWAVFEDREGVLTAVTKDEDNYFLNRFDRSRFRPIRPNSPFRSMFGYSWSQIAVHSRTGDWWLATGSGLLRYHKGLDKPPDLQGPELGLRRGNIFRVFEDSQGGLWVSIRQVSNNGLYRRDPGTGRFKSFGEPDGLPSLHRDQNRPAAFAEDPSGQIWIGMHDGGLVRYREGRFQQVPASTGAPDQGVGALLVDRRGRLWVGSRRQGLLRLDDPSAAHSVFTAYTKSSGLSGNAVLALAEDLTGRIYAASGSSIDRIDPARAPGAEGIRHFTTADGLLPGELRVAFRDRYGALWFGCQQGLIRIQPQEDRSDPPEVLVYSIRVNGETRRVSDVGEIEPAALSLSPSERELQVEFGGFRQDLLYQTRLSSVDRDWTPPSQSRSAHYQSLAPGSHELWIRATTPEGAISPRPARVRLLIARPVWQRWWFLLCSAGALTGLVYAAHRRRLAHAVMLERVRTRIASDLHDDIGSSLSQIAVLSEVVRLRVNGQDPSVAIPLSRIGDISRELVDSMSDIVWAIDPRHDHLEDLVHRMRRFAVDLVSAGQIRFELQVRGSGGIPIDASARRDLFLIFKESVHNAVRHSGCTAIRVEIGAEGGRLRLRVADDGSGFVVGNERNGGHGLDSMRRRAEKLGGVVTIASSRGQGTSVELVAPLPRA